MTDDRRERYARALCEAGDLDWDIIKRSYPLDIPLILADADAAIAVADEEIRERLLVESGNLTRAGFVQAAGFLAGGIYD